MSTGFDYYLRTCKHCESIYRAKLKRSKVCDACKEMNAIKKARVVRRHNTWLFEN